MQRLWNRSAAAIAATLVLSLTSACGSSKPAATSEPKPTEKQADSADPSDFCERYKRMYCTREGGDNGELIETTFDKLSPDEQAAVADECKASYAAATEEELAAMETCLGQVASCDVTSSCITR